MATIQASSIMFAAGLPSFYSRSIRFSATMNAPKIRMNNISLPKLSKKVLVEDLELKNIDTQMVKHDPDDQQVVIIEKFYSIMEAVADRVEMHKSVGEQRDSWNQLFLSSINGLALTAALITGLAAGTSVNGSEASLLAMKLSSTILYAAVTAMMALVNKIQPSQLAEEQRNAARLFKLLHGELQTVLALTNPGIDDVNEAMEKVLALDRAYPLPLLGTMLEKFPCRVEPAVWWPHKRRKQRLVCKINGDHNNGWDANLEEEMRRIVEVMKERDLDDYLRLGNIALKLNKTLAVLGPLLTGLGAIASAFISTSGSSWAVIVGVVAGALATIVNTFEHGSQLGMVFEIYRGNAGFFKLMEESIESNVNESDVERRENGEVFEMKVALCLGRSLSELRNLAASSSSSLDNNGEEANKEFASKLF